MIGFVMTLQKGHADLLLYDVAQSLMDRGHRPGGVVQIDTPNCDTGRCDMDVQVLPDGPVLRISQSLGRASRGCRLDPSALETSVGLVNASLDAGIDVLIINKFGKQEAAGRGFRDVIAKAILREVPVLVAVSPLNEAEFKCFAGTYASKVAAKKLAVLAWLDTVAPSRIGRYALCR